jgi:hypothetical protein
MDRRRGAQLFLLVGLVAFAHPVVADGPGPDPVYTYESFDVDPQDTRTVRSLVELDERGAVVDGAAAEAVRRAEYDTYERNLGEMPSGVSALRGARYVAIDGEREFYLVTTRVHDGTLRIDATAVTTARVVDYLAVPSTTASETTQRAVAADTVTTASLQEPQVVETDSGYVLVRQTDEELVSDPQLVPKMGLYTVGGAFVVGGVVFYPRGRERELLDGY